MNDIDNDEIEHLIKRAGKRAMPNPIAAELTKNEVLKEWQSAVQKNRYRALIKRLTPISLAASLLIATLLGWQALSGSQNLPIKLLLADGNCQFDEAAWQKNNVIATTADCSLVLDYNGSKIILVPESELLLMSKSHLQLNRGRAYIDAQNKHDPLLIETTFGSIEDIGTIFDLSVDTNQLQLTMREGKVKITTPTQTVLASERAGLGDQLLIRSGQDPQRTAVKTTDERWHWTQKLQPSFAIDGRHVADLLQWSARVRGLKISYATEAAMNIALSASLSGEPVDARSISSSLPQLLKVAGLEARIKANQLIVSESPTN